MRFEQHLRTFLQVLDEYPENTPLAKFLPGYFRQHKQMGSSDRRTVSRLLYTYYRLGVACAGEVPSERLFLAEFLCSSESPFLAHFKPELAAQAGLGIAEKLTFLESYAPSFSREDLFPFGTHLSGEVDREAFLRSLLVQPDLFIRIHPGKEKQVISTLRAHDVSFSEEGTSTLRLPNGTKLDRLFGDDAAFEVQDLSSQQTGDYFRPGENEKWWDACAASGGKSILLLQQQPSVKLVVSDIRESVLANLDDRFSRVGLRGYQRKVLDLTQNPDVVLHDYAFDGIVLDAPCTGSGTWGRSPEMISQFREGSILAFQRLQRAIVSNVVRYLKPGKPLIYITCSVFKEENEEMTAFIASEFGLKIEQAGMLKGYESKADTMYVARLRG